MKGDKALALILADLCREVREFEAERIGRRRVVYCHPEAVTHLRLVVASFPEAHLISVVGSRFIPLRHLVIRGLGLVGLEAA